METLIEKYTQKQLSPIPVVVNGVTKTLQECIAELAAATDRSTWADRTIQERASVFSILQEQESQQEEHYAVPNSSHLLKGDNSQS